MFRDSPPPPDWRRRLARLGRRMALLAGGPIRVGSLEFFLADTCNLRCGNCAACSPFLEAPNFPCLATFTRSLSHLGGVLRADQLKLLGGEPLLNRSICDFMQVARRSEIFREIRVTTNGLLLDKVSGAFWELADVVEISLYPSTEARFPAGRIESIRAIAAKHGKRIEVNRPARFMKAVSDTRIEDGRRVAAIFADCGEAHDWPCHLLRGNRIYRCSRVPTLDAYLQTLGRDHADFTLLDGFVIDARGSLKSELGKYLTSRRPLEACNYCFGTSGPPQQHFQLPVRVARSGPKKSSSVPVP